MRGHVIRALLYKEALRYRYNWGLLVMLSVLVILAALVSLGSRLRILPRLSGHVRECTLIYPQNSPEARALADHLSSHPPPSPLRLRVLSADGWTDRPSLPEGEFAIEIAASGEGPIQVKYWHLDSPASEILPYRDWF